MTREIRHVLLLLIAALLKTEHTTNWARRAVSILFRGSASISTISRQARVAVGVPHRKSM